MRRGTTYMIAGLLLLILAASAIQFTMIGTGKTNTPKHGTTTTVRRTTTT
jgi:hypothetical protein